MTKESLSKISTQWTEMEELVGNEGPVALANYLAAKYFDVLAYRFRKYCPQLDDLQAHEMASDVMYKLIKNDYSALNRLDRNKGHLRGLFFKIIKTRLYERRREKNHHSLQEFDAPDNEVNVWINICLDFKESLEKMGKARPRLYQPFYLHYMEGKKIAEISQDLGLKIDAVKQRLYSARRYLAELLQDYREG